jgi:ubiquinone/menaquinone biosynthesis C-methylase UbiE
MPESHLRHYYKTSDFYLEGLLSKEGDYHPAYVQLVQSLVAPGSLILDLGAGTGASSRALAKTCKTIAFDLSHLFLSSGEPHSYPDLHRVAGDAQALPFQSASFDLVGAFEMVEHVWNVELLLEEVHRVLKPGGLVLIVSPNMLSPVNSVLNLLREARRGVIHLSWLRQAVSNGYATTSKLMAERPVFLTREVPERNDLHSDMDACYMASPVDLKKWFTGRHYQVRRYQKGGRTGVGRTVNWLCRSYAPTIYFVAQKPAIAS